tara:strand:- start:2670 stop:3338 length:669 start_codon:yes stop_codon:yes gene_type:complete
MSSQRFPGKVLHNVIGRPLLGYTFDRIRKANHLDGIILATSELDEDAPIAHFAKEEGVSCFRGPLENVALRMFNAGCYENADAILRISGDSPMIDPLVVSSVAARFKASSQVDVVTNVQERTFPKGQSVEVFSMKAMERLLNMELTENDLEHVTSGFYRHPDEFNISNIKHTENMSDLQLSVDTPEDMRVFELLVERFRSNFIDLSFQELAVALFKVNLLNK